MNRSEITLFYFFLLFPVHCLRVGYLTTSGQSDRSVLQKCLPKKSFELVTLPACQNFSGVENAAILHYSHNVDLIVADECDEEFDTLSKLSSRWVKPFVTFGHTALPSPDLSHLLIFAPSSPLGVASGIAPLAEHANWDQVAFFKEKAVDQSLDNVFKSFERLVKHNWTIAVAVDGTEDGWVQQVASRSRVLFIIALPTSIEKIFHSFYSQISSPSDFTIIFVDLYRLSAVQFYVEVDHVLQELEIKARIIRNLSSVHFDTKAVREFAFSNRKKIESSLENHLLLCDLFPLLLSKNASQEEDVLWNRAVIETTGISGPIFISNGVRYSFLKLSAHINGKAEEIAEIIPEDHDGKIYHRINGTDNLAPVLEGLPPAVPDCGFSGEKCPVGHIFLIAAVIVCVFSIPLGIAFYLQRKEDELIRMPWRVAFEQLAFKQEAEHPGYRRISAYSESTSSQDERQTGRVFAYIGNSKVTAQHFHQKRAISFSRAEMERLNQLKNLNHSNVNPFVGMTFNQNAELVVLWNYCLRGSLDDVCFGSGKRLGRNFQSTFLKHILHGLKYLHSSAIKAHGSLYLTNCVVDSYWVVRLSDFGLNGVLKSKMNSKELATSSSLNLDYMPKKYLQLPPEHLAVLKESCDTYALPVTVEGDIYQFGMLMYQILFYKRPFRERREDNEEIINMICDSERRTSVRPLVAETKEFSMRLLSIMQQCWIHKVEYRPPLFKIIDAVAREFGHSAKGTLIDQMITMIDEYSANLEDIVSERTKELEEAQEKTETLLYRMVPRNIANALRDGLPVRPQLHPAVSLLVCDVCRFTALCESSIPEHIIDILQSLYSSFDQIISEYNCFKVENVGDAYLLVSGIQDYPNHLSEVARIALDIQRFTRNFTVPHKTDFKLQIKIGISAGTVASGILGSLSPRFCLFGDTVNMAYRMASTSLPDKIQLTEQSQNQLSSKFPDFIVEERGLIDVKGKGPSMTYWLLGEKPPEPIFSKSKNDDVFLDVVNSTIPKSGRSMRSWKSTARGLKT